MADGVEDLRWHTMPTGVKHAWRAGELRSVCTTVFWPNDEALLNGPDRFAGQGRRSCYWCRKALGLATKASRRSTPVRSDMQVEFVGGPLDGVRIPLAVEQFLEDPNTMRVIGRTYTQTGESS